MLTTEFEADDSYRSLAFWALHPEQMDMAAEYFEHCETVLEQGQSMPDASKELKELISGREELLKTIVKKAEYQADRLTRELSSKLKSVLLKTGVEDVKERKKYDFWESTVYFRGRGRGPKQRETARLQAGFDIVTMPHGLEQRLEVIAWLWVSEEPQCIEKVIGLLKPIAGQEIVKSQSLFPEWWLGTIILSRTVLNPDPKLFEFDLEGVIKASTKALEREYLSATTISQLTALANEYN